MPDFKQIIDEVRDRMRFMGYRPMSQEDIKPGHEAVMVETERYYLSGKHLPPIGMAGTTVIRIDEAEPTRDSKIHEGGRVVFYRCICPQWNGNCFVGIRDIARDELLPGDPVHTWDTRYFVKA